VKGALKHAGQAVVGMLPAALLAQLGEPALAALVFLAILVLGVACWIISDPERSDRVNRMLLARRGNARCLASGRFLPSSHSPSGVRRRRQRQRPSAPKPKR
jgi:hypothetical protein